MKAHATSDGIKSQDWDPIRALAADYANRVISGDQKGARDVKRSLSAQLRALEKKYGRSPSVLATMADYVHGTERRVKLLEEAWAVAQQRRDDVNLVFISSSLAETFAEDVGDEIGRAHV